MDAIHKGRVQMRPRWHFILLSTLTIVGAFIVLLTLLYVASLAVFFLRDSGVWFAPEFGVRGWLALARSTPWLLVLFIIVFVAVLETLVRHYRFIYRTPLLASVVVIFVIVALGGFAISQTRFHRSLAHGPRPGENSPLAFLYHGPLRMPRPPDAYHGEILDLTQNGFIMVDEDDAGTTTVVVTPRTRLPNGSDFGVGERVIVIGDSIATSTVRAFGIRDIDE